MNIDIGGVTYTRLCCSECGVMYFFIAKWCETARRDGKGWKCPNGHGQWYGESEFDKLRRERDQLKQREARLIGERDEAQSQAQKIAAAKQRLQRRISAGTCPCCQRTVRQLAQHMKTKHPDYANNVVKLAARK